MRTLKSTLCMFICAVLVFSLTACKKSESDSRPYTNLTIPAQNVMMVDLDPIAAAKLIGDKNEIGLIFENSENFSSFAQQIDDSGLSNTYNADYFKTGDLIFTGIKTKSNIGYGLVSVNLTGDILTVTLENFDADAEYISDVYIGVFIETEKLYAQGIKNVLVDIVEGK